MHGYFSDMGQNLRKQDTFVLHGLFEQLSSKGLQLLSGLALGYLAFSLMAFNKGPCILSFFRGF